MPCVSAQRPRFEKQFAQTCLSVCVVRIILATERVQSLPAPSQDGFERPQAPVVVLLRREELAGEVEHGHELAPESFALPETLREKNDL